jgi:hypothetical protein
MESISTHPSFPKVSAQATSKKSINSYRSSALISVGFFQTIFPCQVLRSNGPSTVSVILDGSFGYCIDFAMSKMVLLAAGITSEPAVIEREKSSVP